MKPAAHDVQSQSAIIFSSKLIRQLEGPDLHLPATYVGVRQVRPAGGKQAKDTLKRKRTCDGDIDDDWSPNVIDSQSNNADEAYNETLEDEDCDHRSEDNSIKRDAIVFKVTNPDGTERRMTGQEKKKLKYEMKMARHLERKEQKRIEHEELIRVQKIKKKERKKLKWLAKKNRAAGETEGPTPQKMNGRDIITAIDSQTEPQSNESSREDQDEELEGKYRGKPPVMLTPAATRVAFDLGVIGSEHHQDEGMTTIFDTDLSKRWVAQIQESMIPIERQREKEDIRPMPYKLVPEIWTRLRPEESIFTGEQKALAATDKNNPASQSDYSMTTVRNASPTYDESAYLVFRHLHQHFKLHIACGAIFGCDYLLYDGRREDKHSFAGLRIHTVTNNNDDHVLLPLPSTYDMHGFVRAMNTARKLALVATVVRSADNPNVARIAIVDLALEAILTAPTHVRKGNTEKRRFVGDTSELTKRKD